MKQFHRHKYWDFVKEIFLKYYLLSYQEQPRTMVRLSCQCCKNNAHSKQMVSLDEQKEQQQREIASYDNQIDLLAPLELQEQLSDLRSAWLSLSTMLVDSQVWQHHLDELEIMFNQLMILILFADDYFRWVAWLPVILQHIFQCSY